MLCRAPFALIFLHFLLPILGAQAASQGAAPLPEVPRLHAQQDQLGCYALNVVAPVYPREARLLHTEGIVKLNMLIGRDGSVAELQAVSGDPLLLDSVIKAVRQWRFEPSLLNGRPVETEVPLTFTFSIEDPPKPAYLHLTNEKVIRADRVREFTDGIEYTVGHQTRHLSPDLVTAIDGCARLAHQGDPKEGDCVPGGGPSFTVRALPLLESPR